LETINNQPADAHQPTFIIIKADKNGRILFWNRRNIMIYNEFLEEILNLLTEPAGAVILHRAGKAIGIKMAQDAENAVGERSEKTFERLLKFIEGAGYGKFYARIDWQRRRVEVVTENSAEAENLVSTNSHCYLLKGLLTGMVSYLFDNNVTCIESECLAKGDRLCRFIIRSI
jgi:predicted hydrocarbon binding protein